MGLFRDFVDFLPAPRICKSVFPVRPFGTATAAIWKIPRRGWRTAFALIVMNLSRDSVTDSRRKSSAYPDFLTGIPHLVSGPRPAWVFFVIFFLLHRFASPFFHLFSHRPRFSHGTGGFAAICAFSTRFLTRCEDTTSVVSGVLTRSALILTSRLPISAAQSLPEWPGTTLAGPPPQPYAKTYDAMYNISPRPRKPSTMPPLQSCAAGTAKK
jgi:hypothetical protein